MKQSSEKKPHGKLSGVVMLICYKAQEATLGHIYEMRSVNLSCVSLSFTLVNFVLVLLNECNNPQTI